MSICQHHLKRTNKNRSPSAQNPSRIRFLLGFSTLKSFIKHASTPAPLHKEAYQQHNVQYGNNGTKQVDERTGKGGVLILAHHPFRGG